MAKRGRPSIKYEKFIEIWEQLMEEERASINAVQNILGGDKNTIKIYRERYEREKSAKELAILKNIELSKTIQEAIAKIKVKEIEVLEKENQQLKSRIDAYLAESKQAEENYAALQTQFDEAKNEFETKQKQLEQLLAIAESRVNDAAQQNQHWGDKYQQLSEQLVQYRQEAAVAKKEVEILREQKNK